MINENEITLSIVQHYKRIFALQEI